MSRSALLILIVATFSSRSSRYSFDIVSGGDGIDLPNNAAARAYAIAAARSIIADDVLCGTLVLSHSIEITAEDGAQLMIVPFSDAIAIDRPLTI